MLSLGATSDKSLKSRTLDWAVKSGQVKLQDYFYPFGAVGHSKEGSQLVWDYFKDNFSLLKEMLSKASPSLMDAGIVNSVSRFCSAERAAEVEAFFLANPLPSSQRRIAQLLENIRASSNMLTNISTSKLATVEYWA
jgi:aminopeptidase N